MRKEMEMRLIRFAIQIFELAKKLDGSFGSNHLSNQIFRSSTGAALNFAETQASESRKDFVHKSSIVLKELRETNVNLKIIHGMNICKDSERLSLALKESDELVAIFYKTVETAKRNSISEK